MVLKNLNLIYSKIVSIIVILSYLKYNAFIFGYSTTDVNSYFTALQWEGGLVFPKLIQPPHSLKMFKKISSLFVLQKLKYKFQT